MSKVRLRANDVLVLEGDEESLANVANDPAFLMMVPFHGESKPRRRAWLAGLIMLATILLAAFNIMTIEMAALTGAAAVVIARCINIRSAYESIDTRSSSSLPGRFLWAWPCRKAGRPDCWPGGLNMRSEAGRSA
jgi:hypothetical protein